MKSADQYADMCFKTDKLIHEAVREAQAEAYAAGQAAMREAAAAIMSDYAGELAHSKWDYNRDMQSAAAIRALPLQPLPEEPGQGEGR